MPSTSRFWEDAALRTVRCILASYALPSVLASFALGMLAGAILLVAATVLQEPQSITPTTPFPDIDTSTTHDDTPLEGPAVLPDDTTAPPHSFAWDDRYAGYLWTVPKSRYDPSDILRHWPPATRGARPIAKRWYATIGRGRLLLQEAEPPAHMPKGAPPRSVTVDLRGCRVRVVTEGLSGRTVWMRKGPLEVCSTDERVLLHGEPLFFVFCPDGAAKEQWLMALLRATQPNTAASSAQRLYAQYIAQLRLQSPTGIYPQEGDANTHADAAALALAPSSTRGSAAGRRGWGRGILGRRGPSGGRGAAPRAASGAAESPEELLERHWHGGVSKPTPPNAPPSAPATPVAEPSPASTPKGGGGGVEETIEPSAASTASTTPFAAAAEHAQAVEPTPPSVSNKTQSSTGAAHPARPLSLPPPPSGQWPLEVGINALLARAFFDVLRNPAAKALMQARCQRKLSLMKVPDYITSIRVVDVCMGTKPPTVFNCRAAPSPTDVVWPQGFFDFAYTGDLHLTIETSVDLREGAVWGQFDRAMAQLEGAGGAGAVAAAGKAMAAAAKEAAAEEANDSSSEGEGEEASESLDAAPDTLSPDTLRDAVPDTSPEPAPTKGGTAHPRGRVMNLANMRKAAAATLRQFADRTADQISRIPLRLKVSIVRVAGPITIWVAPPPSNRLWYSFTQPPELDIRAAPELGNRILRHTASAARVSAVIERKLRHAFLKNLVFPMCSDLVVPLLMDWQHDHAAAPFNIPLGGAAPSSPVPSPPTAAASTPPPIGDPTAPEPAGVLSTSPSAVHHAPSAPALAAAAAAPAAPTSPASAPSFTALVEAREEGGHAVDNGEEEGIELAAVGLAAVGRAEHESDMGGGRVPHAGADGHAEAVAPLPHTNHTATRDGGAATATTTTMTTAVTAMGVHEVATDAPPAGEAPVADALSPDSPLQPPLEVSPRSAQAWLGSSAIAKQISGDLGRLLSGGSAPARADSGSAAAPDTHQQSASTDISGIAQGIAQLKTNPQLNQMNQNAKRFTENLKKAADARLRKHSSSALPSSPGGVPASPGVGPPSSPSSSGRARDGSKDD